MQQWDGRGTWYIIFTALRGMQARSSDQNSVCPYVKRMHCDKTEERSVQIFIPYERSHWSANILLDLGRIQEDRYLVCRSHRLHTDSTQCRTYFQQTLCRCRCRPSDLPQVQRICSIFSFFLFSISLLHSRNLRVNGSSEAIILVLTASLCTILC